MEKTEKPTPRRIREARKRGQILHSKDLTGTAAFVVSLLAMILLWPVQGRAIGDLFDRILAAIVRHAPDHEIRELLAVGLLQLLPLSLAALLAGGCVAFLVGLIQTRGAFAVEAVKPSLERINPVAGSKRMFSSENLIQLLKTILKTLFVLAAVAIALRSAAYDLLQTPHASNSALLSFYFSPIVKVLAAVVVVYLMLAAIDYGHQYYEYMKRLRMSKEEVRQEYRNEEGDPHMKQERKRIGREMV